MVFVIVSFLGKRKPTRGEEETAKSENDENESYVIRQQKFKIVCWPQ